MNPPQDDSRPVEKRTVSIKKVEANRRNAQKSTGPKTPRGKRYSRQNAIKHGLFIRTEDWDGEEDPQELKKCYKRLLEELQPVGFSEQMEVEQIAICWLRLQRLWRYENAEVEAGRTSVSRNQENGRYHPIANSPTRRTQILLLRSAEKEAEVSGRVSQELMEKIFSENSFLAVTWNMFEAAAEKTAQRKRQDITIAIAEARKIPLHEAKKLLVSEGKSLPERERFVAVETVREAIRDLTRGWWNLHRWELQNEYQRQLIPDDR
jgi:hypothetical protein